MAPRESRIDRLIAWGMFVLPAICGCIYWVKSDDYPPEFAYLCWGCAVLGAMRLLFDYYGTPPRDR